MELFDRVGVAFQFAQSLFAFGCGVPDLIEIKKSGTAPHEVESPFQFFAHELELLGSESFLSQRFAKDIEISFELFDEQPERLAQIFGDFGHWQV